MHCKNSITTVSFAQQRPKNISSTPGRVMSAGSITRVSQSASTGGQTMAEIGTGRVEATSHFTILKWDTARWCSVCTAFRTMPDTC